MNVCVHCLPTQELGSSYSHVTIILLYHWNCFINVKLKPKLYLWKHLFLTDSTCGSLISFHYICQGEDICSALREHALASISFRQRPFYDQLRVKREHVNIPLEKRNAVYGKIEHGLAAWWGKHCEVMVRKRVLSVPSVEAFSCHPQESNRNESAQWT